MTDYDGPKTKFHALMQEQIFNEFTAAQQYIAIAVGPSIIAFALPE